MLHKQIPDLTPQVTLLGYLTDWATGWHPLMFAARIANTYLASADIDKPRACEANHPPCRLSYWLPWLTFILDRGFHLLRRNNHGEAWFLTISVHITDG